MTSRIYQFYISSIEFLIDVFLVLVLVALLITIAVGLYSIIIEYAHPRREGDDDVQ